MVQESTNTFSDGLIKDLNPLTTPNTVLTDAKNATLLTFNGNELVLQNDLGNSKINNTWLKEGYNPIGIKEYGGILYIVSMNQEGFVEIGSFPSPEIQAEETNNPTIDEISVSSEGVGLNKNILISDKKINPGDKFLIAFILNDINLISESFGNVRNYYKIKLLSINEGSEIDLTNYLVNQKKYNSESQTYNNTNHWFVPLNEEELLNFDFEDYVNYLQIYKHKKSGYLAIRIELETIDEFKIQNEDNTEYPILEQTNLNKTVTFNLNSKFESKIKPNLIIFNGNLYNKDTLVNTILSEQTIEFIPNTSTEYNTIDKETSIIIPIEDGSLNKILDYTIEIKSDDTKNIDNENKGYDILFDKFTLKNRIDLSKDPLSWNTFKFWAVENNNYLQYDELEEWYNYLIIARYGNVNGIKTKLKNDDSPIENILGEHAAYIYSGISEVDYVNYTEYDIIGTFDIDLDEESETYNKPINFKNLIPESTLDTCTDTVRYQVIFKSIPSTYELDPIGEILCNIQFDISTLNWSVVSVPFGLSYTTTDSILTITSYPRNNTGLLLTGAIIVKQNTSQETISINLSQDVPNIIWTRVSLNSDENPYVLYEFFADEDNNYPINIETIIDTTFYYKADGVPLSVTGQAQIGESSLQISLGTEAFTYSHAPEYPNDIVLSYDLNVYSFIEIQRTLI